MSNRIILSCLFLWLYSTVSYGQDRQRLSLPQMWEQAYNNYPSVEAFESQLQQAIYQKKLVKNRYLPQVLLQAQNTVGTNQAVGGAFFPLPGIYNIGGSDAGIPSDPSANTFGSVTMDWKFMQFGKHRKSVEASDIRVNQATSQIAVEKLTIQTELSRDYIEALYHLQMVRWAEANQLRLQSLFSAARSMADAGISPGADSLLIKASLQEAASSLNDWRGQKEESEVLLGVWIGMVPDQIALEHAPLLQKADDFVKESAPVNTSHPLLAFRQDEIQYAETTKQLAKVSALPSFSLLAGIQTRIHSPALGNPVLETWSNSYRAPVNNYLVGLGMSWNINGLFDHKLNKNRHQEEVLQRQAEAEETSLNLLSQQQIAERQLAQGDSQIQNAEEAYKSAGEAFRLFESRYNSGLISITELLQIQDILQRTEKTRIEAYYQYWMQQVDLALAQAYFSLLQSAFE
jgi:outer membrane protein TolC